MFSNLRAGTPIYVLHKNEPRVEIGEVLMVSTPMPQFGSTYTAGYLQPQQMFVDIKLKVDGNEIDLQKLPADKTIADFGTNGMVVSETRDGIINEVVNMRRTSEAVIASVSHHQDVVAKCNGIIEDMNPQAKAEADQRRDIDEMKTQMADIQSMLAKLLTTKGKGTNNGTKTNGDDA